MGTMTGPRCDHWRGLLAMELVGQLDHADRIALQAHTEGCSECREDAAELASLSVALPLADPTRLRDQSAPPPGLADAILTRVRQEQSQEVATRKALRHRRARRAVAASVVGALAAGAIAFAVVTGGAGVASGRTLALSGAPGVVASVKLTSATWGSNVELQEKGQPAGQVMWVIMGDGRSGRPWMGGSYRTVGEGTVRVSFSCALAPDRITRVWVDDSHGHTVLSSDYEY